jgi:uncharacterized membrane protein (DUF4010 family)
MDAIFIENTWQALATSIACGALIGIERERRKKESAIGSIAGLRTFASAALLGTTAAMLQLPGLVLIGAVLLILLIGISYARSDPSDAGITTEVALFLTYLIGVTAYQAPAIASAITVCLTILLLARTRLHRFATQTLTPSEIRDGLILASAITLILPILPTGSVDPSGMIEPRKLWMIVVLLLTIQIAAHVGLRAMGQRFGLAFSGFASGFVSSTSAFAAMAAKSKRDTDPSSYATACLLSQVASLLQLIGLVALLTPQMMTSIGISIALSSTVLLVAVFRKISQEHPPPPNPYELPLKEEAMFNLSHTLVFAALLATITVILSWLNRNQGPQSTMYAAIIAGVADMHASSAAILSLADSNTMTQIGRRDMLITVLSIMSINACAKLMISYAGSKAFFRAVAPTLILSALSSWAGLFLA